MSLLELIDELAEVLVAAADRDVCRQALVARIG